MNEAPRPLVYFDANAFIYAFEGEHSLAGPLEPLLRAIQAQPGLAATSELVLAELLAPVKRPGALPADARKRLYLNLLISNSMFELRPVTRDILIATADVRERRRLKLPHAIHVVTAINAGFRFLLSNDPDTDLCVDGLILAKPDEAGVQLILDELR